MRKFTFSVKGEEHCVIVSEDEDSRKALREKLNLKRLPNGVEVLENREVKYSEMTAEEIAPILNSEKERLSAIKQFIKDFPTMGPGWPLVAKSIAKNIREMEKEILKKS